MGHVGAWCGQNKYLSAIKNAFQDYMPATISGAVAVLWTSVLVNSSTGLGSFFSPIMVLEPLNSIFSAINTATIGCIAVGICMLVGENIALANGETGSYPAILAFMMWFTVTPYSWSIGDMAAYTPAVEGTMGAQTSTVTISQLLEEVLNSGFVAEYNTFSSDTFADVTNSVKLPLIKKRNNIVDTPVKGKKLKEANIIPYHDIYILSFVFEDATEVEMINEKPKHICAIDLGVNNFAAITNNIGKECLLFKGEVFMSKN